MRRLKWAAENPDKIKAYAQKPEKKEYLKQWWINNRDKASAYRKKQRAKDPEKTKAFDKARHQKYKEKNRVVWREYARKHRDKFRAGSRKWRIENPEKVHDNRTRYRTKMRTNATRLTRGTIKRLKTLQNGLCAHCKIDLEKSGHHLDHIIPISKGGLHCDSNVQLLCPPCNLSKGAKIIPPQ